MRSIHARTALVGTLAGLLATAPAALAGDAGVKAVQPDDRTALEQETRDEYDIRAHRAADPSDGSFDPTLSKNADQNADGDLIAEGRSDETGSFDPSLSENVDVNDDGDLIADDADQTAAGSEATNPDAWPDGERPVGMDARVSTDAAADTAAEGGADVGTPEERLESLAETPEEDRASDTGAATD